MPINKQINKIKIRKYHLGIPLKFPNSNNNNNNNNKIIIIIIIIIKQKISSTDAPPNSCIIRVTNSNKNME
jgi:hypothetical protein